MNCDKMVCILMEILWILLCLQLFDLSGILTVFFCGIVMAHYTWYNITENSRITTRYVISDDSFSLIWNQFFFRYTRYICLWVLWNMSQRRNHFSVFPFCYYICRHTFATFSFVSEIFIFLYVGMDAIDMEKWKVVSKR